MHYHNLVQEILDELLLQRPRRQQAVEIGAKEFSDEIAFNMVSPRIRSNRIRV